MSQFPETSQSLILRVRDHSDHAAWAEFESLYRPVIFRIARGRGLQHADAQDLVQQVLVSVSTAIRDYQSREEGPRFRNWVSRIVRNAIIRALTRGPKTAPRGGSAQMDLLAEVPAVDSATASLIQQEYRREVFLRAADEVRSQVEGPTWLAFEQSVLHHRPVAEVAKLLDLSVGSIYAARSRVMRRLRVAVERMADPEWGESANGII